MLKAKLKLISLRCDVTEDFVGGDEAYLRVDGKTVWGPTPIAKGQTLSLQTIPELEFTGITTVQLMDQDTGVLDPDDDLGTIAISSSDWSTATKTDRFTGDGADYTITYLISIVGAPDGKEPVFPLKVEGYFGGNPGYVWFNLDESGDYSMTIRGKHSGVTGSSRYTCCVVITGFKNGKANVVLNKPSSRTNTVGADSGSGHATKDVAFTTRDPNNPLVPVAPEDVPNIRNIAVLFGKEVHGQNFKDVVIASLQAAGAILDEADALYKKWNDSDIGQAVALATASG